MKLFLTGFFTVVLVLLSFTGAGEAVASDDPPTLALSQLALPDGITLSPGNAAFSLYVPVNPGLRPRQARFRLLPAPGLAGASLWLENGGRIIAATSIGNEPAEWRVPLSGTEIRNGLVELRLHFVAVEEKEHCVTDQATWVHFEPTSQVTFSHIKASPPLLLGQFFPPRLERVYVHVDEKWSRRSYQSLLDLAAYLARTRVPAPRIIPREAGTPLPASLSPFDRVVVIGGEKSEVFPYHEDGHPPYSVLRLAPGADGKAPRLLFGTLRDLSGAMVTGLTGLEGGMPAQGTSSGGRHTLAALGYDDMQVEGRGSMTVRYRFSQADLGGPVEQLAVRLAGAHASVPEGAQAHLWLRMNGVLFYSQTLEGSGFDLYAPVPGHLLQRDNTLEVVFVYTPPGGLCEPGTHPFAATLWKSSYLQFEKGQTLPAGFARFPQAYVDGMNLVIEPLDLEHVSQAVRLLAAMQRTTRAPLFPDLGPSGGEKPLLYIGERALPDAPLQLSPFVLRASSGRELLRFEPGSPFAALEAWDETVMLAGPVSLASRLLDGALQPDGWYSVSGDTWLQGISGRPRGMRLLDTGITVTPLPESPRSLWGRYRNLGFLLLGVLLLALLAWLYPRVVREGRPR